MGKGLLIITHGSRIEKTKDVILKYAKPEVEIYDSALMNLDEIIELMVKSYNEGKEVARK